MKLTKILLGASALSAAMALSGCMGSSSQTGAHGTALNSMSMVNRAANSEPSQSDLNKSCSEIDAELARLYARNEELERAAKAEQRKGALARGAVNAGLSALTYKGITNAGSASGIRKVGTASSLAGGVANVTMGGSGPDAKTMNQSMAIYERTSLLERTKLSKGC